MQDLKVKHERLKKLDGGSFFKKGLYKVFGSSTHHYYLNPPLSKQALTEFEKLHGINLPSDYKVFLNEIGNGGSGPAYGLFALLDWNYELEIDDPLFLAKDFHHMQKWNETYNLEITNEEYTLSDEFKLWEDGYFSSKHVAGSMRICHDGCGIYYLLVVTGREAGYIWIDSRANDQGIYPFVSQQTGKHMTFKNWYEQWLDESLYKLTTP